MRILLCSTWFAPSIGGVETVSKILGEEFSRAGATVTVVTSSAGPEFVGEYKVIRQPSREILRLLGNQSDVIFQNLISLRTLVPLLPCRKPIVITHGSWLRRSDGSRGFENYLKMLFLRTATNVSISESIAKDLPVSSIVIGNPFDAEEFQNASGTVRDRDIVFMGRLVSDKGCDLLLQAFSLLKRRGLTPSLSIIGDGPDKGMLKDLAVDLGIASQLEFLGAIREGRGAIVARHRIMAIPSRWAEPFGVVALEGIAAGCAIVASCEGGLKDAVGACGVTFPNGDVSAMADALEELLTDENRGQMFLAHRTEHLQQFQPKLVARRYLELFRKVKESKIA